MAKLRGRRAQLPGAGRSKHPSADDAMWLKVLNLNSGTGRDAGGTRTDKGLKTSMANQ